MQRHKSPSDGVSQRSPLGQVELTPPGRCRVVPRALVEGLSSVPRPPTSFFYSGKRYRVAVPLVAHPLVPVFTQIASQRGAPRGAGAAGRGQLRCPNPLPRPAPAHPGLASPRDRRGTDIPLQTGSPWFSMASGRKQGRRATEMKALRICALFASHRQRWRKTAEYDLTLPPGAEASLPLTGGNLCGTPSLLRKMWMKHKKKSEYLGATNSAFEAD